MRFVPHVSEKAYDGAKAKQKTYAFRVPRGSEKLAIARAIAEAYSVKVDRVRTVAQPSKSRRRGKRGGGTISGTKAGFKKAYVTLKEGESIKELSS